ncbi:MAG TPA: class I SAM-dependent methyltransferase [Chthoniobacteraceae bacterium]|jgi:methyltransferase-like protein/2-polyprenyl-3-methyl-5-hydroxy-6-metoxy-1,4-benzoquinol methylase|nr:class I SAM-dependent methyltransferase [Chthoniobacteraceae bacterium]
MSDDQNPYDEMPYTSDPFPQTHPAVLASVATLMGVDAPPVDHCTVLEIGCASGGNLIPMAQELPNSRFTGIDLSARQIKEAGEAVAVLGLKNIEFQKKDVLEITPEFGQFDYIIAHGIYSWVPDPVAEKILDICAKNLSPRGIAYVSYNTLPGWHIRGMIRDMMIYHTRNFARPEVKTRQARALLNFLAEAVPGENNPYGMHMQNELNILRRMRDSYIRHDHLENENNPVYFHEFVEQAEKHDLQYLGEAQFGVMAIAASQGVKSEVWNTLMQVCSNTTEREQYLDFLRNRQFRQTLLVHKNVAVDRSLNPEHMSRLFVTTMASPKAAMNLESEEPDELQMPSGAAIPVRQPLMKAAVTHLAEIWPKAISFPELRKAARSRLSVKEGQPEEEALIKQDTTVLGNGLRSLYALGFVDFSSVEPATSPDVSEQPAATPLVRYQAQRGSVVTNRRHRSISVNEFDRRVLEQLDGSRTAQDLHKVVSELIRNGTLTVKKSAPAEVDQLIDQTIDASLKRFKQSNLLVR